MQPFSIMRKEGSGSEIVNFKVDLWHFGVLFAVDVFGVGSGLAFGDVGVVGGVLGVDEEELVVHVFKLLFAQKVVLEHGGLLGPVDDRVILLVDPVVRHC